MVDSKRRVVGQDVESSSEPLRLIYMNPEELTPHEFNWRTHSESQLTALTDVIAEVGWAGACLYNERSGRLIDGHARRKVALEQGATKVPVLVGDWDEATEKKILATLDPLAAMATADAAKLDALLREVDTGSEALQQMLSGLAERSGLYGGGADASGTDVSEAAPPEEFSSYGEDIPTEHECPKCGYRWSGKAGPSDES